MGFQHLNTAFDLINDYGGDFEGVKSPGLIDKAERALGLKFPPTYRKFLEVLGCGDIDGLEFYGVINDEFENSSIPNAIWLTLDERKAGLPNNLILVYGAGDGTYYAIDTSQVDDEGESPVVAYSVDGKTEKISDDFGSFLLSELRTIL